MGANGVILKVVAVAVVASKRVSAAVCRRNINYTFQLLRGEF